MALPEEAGSGSDWIGYGRTPMSMSTSGSLKTLAFQPETQGKPGRTILPPGDRMSPMSTSFWLKTFGFSTRNPRKAGQDDSATRRQDVANEHQFLVENLGFSTRNPRKAGQDARAFRIASKSGSLLRNRPGSRKHGMAWKAGRRGCGGTVRGTAALIDQWWEWHCRPER